MSAWIVSSAHIDVLVQAGVQFGIVEPGADLTALGKTLWTENFRSVNYLYGERHQRPRYAYAPTELGLDPVKVYKTVGCYEYQTREHPTWKTSAAYAYCERLTAAVSAQITAWEPSRHEPAHQIPVGWEAAPWGIDRVEDAASVAEEIDATLGSA